MSPARPTATASSTSPRADPARARAARLCWKWCTRRGRRSNCAAVVKRFGEIVAVAGLDLVVRAGGLLRAPRAQRGRQVDDHAVAHRPVDGRRGLDSRARLHAARRVQAGPHGDGRRAPAGQPRCRADLPADPERVRPAVPGSARRSAPLPSTARWRSPISGRARTRSSASSREACAGGCWSPAA